MAYIPKKVFDRISKSLPTCQKILAGAKARDVNESDTVTIVIEILSSVLGFDKFTEITSEFAIKSTFCDLAIKIDDQPKFLIEVKAIGLTLKENHLLQASNYAANHGIPWVVLTNSINWEVYRVKCDGKVTCEQTCSINLESISIKREDDLQKLYVLCKEGVLKDAMD